MMYLIGWIGIGIIAATMIFVILALLWCVVEFCKQDKDYRSLHDEEDE
jgi:hypothetical protein